MKSLNNISIKGLYLLFLACMMIGTQGKLFCQPPPPPPPAASFIPDTITSTWSCSTHQATVHVSIDRSYVHLPVTYHWSTGATTPMVTLTQGVYYVTMVDDSSVTSIDSVVVSGWAGPDQNVNANSTVTMAAIGTGIWSALSTNPTITVITNNSSPATTITGFTIIGIYSFVWNMGGCSDTISVTVASLPDSVWPGDADNNRLVDNEDLLPIGLAYDSTGPVRTTQGIVWQGDAATDWAHNFAAYSPTLDFKFADCNGDGIINAADTAAIMQNFSLTHAKHNGYTNSVRSGLPAMKLIFSKDTVLRGDTLIVSILLGDSNTHVNGIYGLAYTFNYDEAIYDSTTTGFTFPTSWLGTAGHSISISKDFHGMGMVKCAITGIDHLSRTGYGKIAQYRGIITTDNINGKNLRYHHNHCYISDIKAIDIHGDTIAVEGVIDSSYVGYVPNAISEIEKTTIRLYPNPAQNQIRVSAESNISEIVIRDILGQEVQTIRVSNKVSEMIDISQLVQGVYTIRVNTQSGMGSDKVVIAR